ncbi:hypothetical protein FFLO_04089 [Filobasidium floriforme]|uniref:Uncharacterized protein n=1 Tax=Filobasidium floriforme TaxID=5210 RepID=A0A8K0JLJ0_9TREE|nr:uncharacterized protein HD553DRAFT_220044 [Filobasidium floriforme]KAG7531784.1 hypothetical protein FFLO_04089 [Filobasidium floriforme]KAH8086534.1 hypothetical protein HD553DRAFT_220044 [Filobasidium floriforme]
MDYTTKDEWTIESILTEPEGVACHWSMNGPEEASPATVVIRYGSYGYKRYGNLPLGDMETPFELGPFPAACNLPTLIRAIAEDSWRPIHFIITPQIGRSDHDHRFCFPKLRPIDQQGENLAIKFESSCSCDDGDSNQFWDGITEALAGMIEQLDKSQEESDDEEDSEGDTDDSEEDEVDTDD